ncbi:MAG: SH3 domain-containing protein [Caldilineaceae bacterium]|nr:SH3 domain-containing protein [Caldilineaceae bacterium]
MHTQPQRTLKRLLKQYGQELIDDPRRTEALLRDLCGQHTREIFVLVNAQKQRVPAELRAAPAWMPRQATFSRLSRLLQTKLALTEDAADWAVAAWASALDLDSGAKGEGWSWLPTPLRAPAPPPSRKPRKKKRQNAPSSVQSGKENSRQSASRYAKERAARAESGSHFPSIRSGVTAALSRMPVAWINALPWIALLTASIFLLAVVYWTSSARSIPIVATDLSGSETPAPVESAIAEAGAALPGVTATAPLLDAAPREYLAAVMPLPAVAQVNVVTLYIREQPTIDSDPLGFLAKGEPVNVIAFSADGRWSQIDQPSSGWVSNEFLLFNSHDATSTSVRLDVQPGRTNSYEVMVRAAPHANAEVTTTLPPSTEVVVAAKMGGETASWVQIADPAIGWITTGDLTLAAP